LRFQKLADRGLCQGGERLNKVQVRHKPGCLDKARCQLSSQETHAVSGKSGEEKKFGRAKWGRRAKQTPILTEIRKIRRGGAKSSGHSRKATAYGERGYKDDF
jgi:hypothetical protein